MNIQPIVESLKAGLELELEKQINAKSDQAVDLLVEELKKLIPGEWENPALEMYKPKLKELVKAKLLELVEPISEKV